MQTKRVLDSILNPIPKILTIYQGHQFIEMLGDLPTYALIIPHIAQPLCEFPRNVCPVTNHLELDFDICVSFSGGGDVKKITKQIIAEKKVDSLIYELDYIYDIISGREYKGNGDYYPTIQFMESVNGNGQLLVPPIHQRFKKHNDINQRKVSVSVFGNMLAETELYSHYSDIRYIVNTIGSCIFGTNPKLGTHAPTEEEKVGIFNSSKIILNTRTAGYFPIELLQGMNCGCVPVSYRYPGIEGILPETLIANDKNHARQIISDLISSSELLAKYSAQMLSISNAINNPNGLTNEIIKKWRDINEFGSKFYWI